MSRGPGIIMVRVTEEVTSEWQSIADLAAAINGVTNPTRADIESVRRACKRLAEQGEIELDYIYIDRTKWRGPVYVDRSGGRWADVITREGYEADDRPLHPFWKLSARSIT